LTMPSRVLTIVVVHPESMLNGRTI
jgi:hypothetical protein